MSWFDRLSEFVGRLLKLENRVERNTEELQALRQEIKELTKYTKKIAYSVLSNQHKIEFNQSKNESERRELMLQLKIALLEMEKRPNVSSNLDYSMHDQQSLPDSQSDSES